MVTAKHVTDGGRTLTEGVVVGQVVLVHSVEDAALTGLHTVAHVGEGTGDDNAHGVLDKGVLDLLFHLNVHDFLIGIFVVFGVVDLAHS